MHQVFLAAKLLERNVFIFGMKGCVRTYFKAQSLKVSSKRANKMRLQNQGSKKRRQKILHILIDESRAELFDLVSVEIEGDSLDTIVIMA